MDRAVPAADEEGPRMFYSHTDAAALRASALLVADCSKIGIQKHLEAEAIHQYNAVINILRYGGLFRAWVPAESIRDLGRSVHLRGKSSKVRFGRRNRHTQRSPHDSTPDFQGCAMPGDEGLVLES